MPFINHTILELFRPALHYLLPAGMTATACHSCGEPWASGEDASADSLDALPPGAVEALEICVHDVRVAHIAFMRDACCELGGVVVRGVDIVHGATDIQDRETLVRLLARMETAIVRHVDALEEDRLRARQAEREAESLHAHAAMQAMFQAARSMDLFADI